MKQVISLLLLVFIQFSTLHATTFEATTFNTGLALTYVPFASERLPFIIDALKKDQSDVICLQEVWRKEDRNKIIKALASEFPFSHYENIKQDYANKKPVCKIREIFGKNKFVTCTQKKCKGKDGDDFTSCVIDQCQESLTKLRDKNKQCAKALMAQVGKSSIKAIWAVVNPFKAASLFSYGGGNGLVLLSKKELKNKKVLDLTKISTLNRRAALSAEIADVGQVMCAHLSADLTGDAPYAGDFSSWGDENAAQVESLIQEANRHNSEVFLMGDFNTGPALESFGIEGELESSYALFLDHFNDNFNDSNPVCTFCSSNLIAGSTNSIFIDHIFSKYAQAKNVERAFEEVIEIDNEKSNLSDHFGLKAFFDL